MWHLEHGWQYLAPGGDNGCYVYDLGMRTWWWMNPTFYPWIYKKGELESWVYYYQDASSERRWFHHTGLDRFVREGTPWEAGFRILVFSKTAGFRHGSISDGITAFQELGETYGFSVHTTENSEDFNDENLAEYATVVFLSTSGEVFNDAQRGAFQRYIRNGGGFAGIHAATTTEPDWAWYGELTAARFTNHPPGTSEALLHIENQDHPSTSNLPSEWQHVDEWYNFDRNPRGEVQVLITIDESSYEGGTMGEDHPLAWYHEFEGGRSWYTALGHTSASFRNETFRNHLLGGIWYSSGVPESGLEFSMDPTD